MSRYRIVRQSSRYQPDTRVCVPKTHPPSMERDFRGLEPGVAESLRDWGVEVRVGRDGDYRSDDNLRRPGLHDLGYD